MGSRPTAMIATRLRVLSIVPLLLVVASCAGAKNDPRTPPSPTDAQVVVTRSGGIAGLDDTITVEPQGRWIRVDHVGTQRSGRLTEDERARLRTLAADPTLLAEENRPTASTTCLDGFTYSVSVGAARVRYVDCPGDKARPATAVSIVELLMKATG